MLTETDKARIAGQVRELEACSGAEIVTAYAERCDHYPEIPWKAFALGTALAAVVVTVVAWLPGERPALSLPVALALCLCTGLAALLLTVALPPFARLFLERARAEAEARQHAEGVFLDRELYAAPGGRAVLLLVARFERRVVILPGHGLREALPPEVLDGIVAVITARLQRDEFAAAFADGLAALEPRLVTGASAAPGRCFPDEPVEAGEP